RDPGRGVVRTARAEIGRALKRHDAAASLALPRVEPDEAFGKPRRAAKPGEARGDHPGDLARRQLAIRRQDPLPGLIVLPDDARAAIGRPVVELLLELAFDDRPLLLDDEHFLQPFGEMADAVG